MSERTLDEVKELLNLLDEEGFVGILELKTIPGKKWLARTERSIKSIDLPNEILAAAQTLSDYLPSAINEVELIRKGQTVDRIKITRKV